MNLYRVDEELGVLRSAGDPPGIVVVALEEGRATLRVTPRWMPQRVARGSVVELSGDPEDAIADGVDVELDDVVDGLVDKPAAELLWQLVGSSFVEGAATMISSGLFEELRAFVDLIEATRVKLEQRVELEGWDG